MCKTIKQKVKLRLDPDRVYHLLADSKSHAALTGQDADISKKIGGHFSALAGRITGINVDLVPGKRLVQAWRAEDFPEGVFSMAAIELSGSKDGGTELVLTHRGVPKQIIPDVEQQWRKFYWDRMRALHE